MKAFFITSLYTWQINLLFYNKFPSFKFYYETRLNIYKKSKSIGLYASLPSFRTDLAKLVYSFRKQRFYNIYMENVSSFVLSNNMIPCQISIN